MLKPHLQPSYSDENQKNQRSYWKVLESYNWEGPHKIDAVDFDNQTPFFFMIEKLYERSLENKFSSFEKIEQILDVLKQLIKDGVDINSKDTMSYTAFFYPVPRLIEFLLENQADPNILSDKGVSALMEMAMFSEEDENRFKCIPMILDAGARIDFKNDNGQTVWDYSSARVKDLLQEVENIKFKNNLSESLPEASQSKKSAFRM